MYKDLVCACVSPDITFRVSDPEAKKIVSARKIGESKFSLFCKESIKHRISSTFSQRQLSINRACTYSTTPFINVISKSDATILGSDDQNPKKKYNNFEIELINHLERNSLVDFDSEEAVSRLQEAISFANTLQEVDTEGVAPMTSTLEDISLSLRRDEVHKTNRSDILINATVVEEDYFVAPPGNIPLDPQRKV